MPFSACGARTKRREHNSKSISRLLYSTRTGRGNFSAFSSAGSPEPERKPTMRKSQSSMTAIGIAIVRAIESDRPEAERICFDPYARQFVNGALYHFVRFFDKLGYSERRGPGVMGFLAVRERHIDEYLKAR